MDEVARALAALNAALRGIGVTHFQVEVSPKRASVDSDTADRHVAHHGGPDVTACMRGCLASLARPVGAPMFEYGASRAELGGEGGGHQ